MFWPHAEVSKTLIQCQGLIVQFANPLTDARLARCKRLESATMKAEGMILERLQRAEVRPTDLADALGISVPFASQILKGRRGIRLLHVDAIAALLEVSIPQLFAEIDPARHTGEGTSNPQLKGGSDVPSPARVRQLEQHSAAYTALLGEVQDVASKLVAAAEHAVSVGENRAAQGTAPHCAQHPRRTRRSPAR